MDFYGYGVQCHSCVRVFTFTHFTTAVLDLCYVTALINQSFLADAAFVKSSPLANQQCSFYFEEDLGNILCYICSAVQFKIGLGRCSDLNLLTWLHYFCQLYRLLF